MDTFTVESTTDESIRHYHIRSLLSERDIIYYDFVHSEEQPLTPYGTQLMQRISTVPGIKALWVGRYSFRIGKGMAFSWQEIHEAVKSILTAEEIDIR